MKILVDIPDDIVFATIEAADVSYWGTVKAWSRKTMNLRVHVDDESKSFTAGRDQIENGVALFAQNLPHHFREMAAETGDAMTGNFLIQTILFGHVEYE